MLLFPRFHFCLLLRFRKNLYAENPPEDEKNGFREEYSPD